MIVENQFVWAEKYRPSKVSECILPRAIKSHFQSFVDKGDVPTMILCGGPGMGKTTIAMAMLDEIDVDYKKIPASIRGNIDTLRNEIANFASTVSFKGKRKYVILDEADYLTHATQPALRNFIDDYADNCGFIFTANYRNRIIEPLQSRSTVIEFHIPRDEAADLAVAFMARTVQILEAEGITKIDKPALAAVIRKHFPDWRRILNEIQRYASTGGIDSGILTNAKEVSIKELLGFIKEKKFSAIRQWAADNVSTDYADLYREFYDTAAENFTKPFHAELVLLIAKYMTQSSMVFDQEINFVAFCTELMISSEGGWK